MELTVVEHPVVQDRLARLRHRDTPPEAFRRAVHEMAMLLAFEATRSLDVRESEVPTPVSVARVQVLAKPVVIVPILRAGLGMAHGILEVLPEARAGHIGLARNETTHRPEGYYQKLPDGLAESEVLLVDPMLATGHSAVEATFYVRMSREAAAVRKRYPAARRAGISDGARDLRPFLKEHTEVQVPGSPNSSGPPSNGPRDIWKPMRAGWTIPRHWRPVI